MSASLYDDVERLAALVREIAAERCEMLENYGIECHGTFARPEFWCWPCRVRHLEANPE